MPPPTQVDDGHAIYDVGSGAGGGVSGALPDLAIYDEAGAPETAGGGDDIAAESAAAKRSSRRTPFWLPSEPSLELWLRTLCLGRSSVDLESSIHTGAARGSSTPHTLTCVER